MKSLKLLVVTLSIAMLMAVSACGGVESDQPIVNWDLNPPQLASDLSCERLSKRFRGYAAWKGEPPRYNTLVQAPPPQLTQAEYDELTNIVLKIHEIKEISFDPLGHLKCSGLAEWENKGRDRVTFQFEFWSNFSGDTPIMDYRKPYMEKNEEFKLEIQ